MRSSVRLTDTALTRISTSPAPGSGVAASSRRITSGAPNSRMTIAFTLAHGVRDERLRRRRAPLRAQAFLRGEQVGRRARVQHIGIGPVLVHAAPRILPVVVDLAAEQMPADAPDVLVLAGVLQVLVTEHQVVVARHLKREMVQAGVRPFEA